MVINFLNSKRYSVSISWVSYFLILLGIGAFTREASINLGLFDTVHEIIKTSIYSDPIYFLTGAIDISENGWISPENQWLINLWPPGFMMLEGYILKIFGNNVPMILVLLILSSMLFATILSQFYSLIVKNTYTVVAFFSPLILFAFPVSRFMLEPAGLVLGETFSIGLFLLFILFMIKASINKSIFYSILSGLFLGLSAYFRSQFEAILLFITLFGVLFVVICIIKSKLFSSNKKANIEAMYVMLTIIAIASVVTLPWRVYNYINNDRVSWTTVSDLTYKNLVMTSEDLHADGGQWIVGGTGNILCLVNTELCSKTVPGNFKLLVKTFFNDPVLWYSLKFKPIGKYWFAKLDRLDVPSKNNAILNILSNIAIMFMFMFILFAAYRYRVREEVVLISWILISVVTCYLAIFTIVHFEVKYFIFPKILIIFLFIVFLNFHIQRSNDEKPIQ